jgi:hypothetical protein
MSGGGGGCESDLTSMLVEMCRWGGPVGLSLRLVPYSFQHNFLCLKLKKGTPFAYVHFNSDKMHVLYIF